MNGGGTGYSVCIPIRACTSLINISPCVCPIRACGGGIHSRHLGFDLSRPAADDVQVFGSMHSPFSVTRLLYKTHRCYGETRSRRRKGQHEPLCVLINKQLDTHTLYREMH